MPLKILATADLHLGRKSSSVPRNLEESSTQFTWRRIIEYAIDKSVGVVVLAGDIVDRDNRFFEAIGPIQEGFEQLKKEGIAVIVVAGNHDFDVLPDVIKSKEYDHVHLLGENGTWEIKKINSGNGELQFIGWSFPRRYVKEDPLLEDWATNLDPNIPTVGVLHGDVTDPESKYAPLDINNLISDSVDAWVLGHIHKPEIYRESEPVIFYPGSPHALSSKEPAMHGPYLLTIDDRAEVTVKQIPLSPIRYETQKIDISEASDESEFRHLVISQLEKEVQNLAEELERVSRMIFDLVLTGNHTSLSELDQWSQMTDQFEQEMLPETIVSIRTIANKAEPKVENIEQLADQPTPPGILARAILDLQSGTSTPLLKQLTGQLKTKFDNINTSSTYQPLRLQEEPLTASDEEVKKYLLQECHRLLGELLLQK